ncbi:conserved hypothetical protein [Serratia proteamaculans]|uniref:hypothetical protein n=1 Tax=Serratia proteamaculans TaxID=28151 RepID=UPI0009F7C4C5|nr:hypothetical protein [Serratia proteamaculans]SMB49026.1 conserved hypothetical protein [Serratia proteamaculans]
MKIYWTLKSIPELKNLPLKERVNRWRKAFLGQNMSDTFGVLAISMLPWFIIIILNDVIFNIETLHNQFIVMMGYIVSAFIGMNVIIRNMLLKNKDIFKG